MAIGAIWGNIWDEAVWNNNIWAQSGGDTTAPVLSSPSASSTGPYSASGSVTTDEGNGTLYYIATANSSENVATVKAGSSQAVSATGSQAVSFGALSASTSYYPHFVHTDAASNDSTVASGAQFTTGAYSAPPSGDLGILRSPVKSPASNILNSPAN